MTQKGTVESRPQKRRREQAEAIARLQGWIKDGDTVYCVLRSRAASGMSRTIQLLTIKPDNSFRSGIDVGHIGYNVARATGSRYNERHEGIVVPGCGFDAGHHIVDELRGALGYQKLWHEWI